MESASPPEPSTSIFKGNTKFRNFAFGIVVGCLVERKRVSSYLIRPERTFQSLSGPVFKGRSRIQSSAEEIHIEPFINTSHLLHACLDSI